MRKIVIKFVLLLLPLFWQSCSKDPDEDTSEQLLHEVALIDARLDEKGITAYEHVSGVRFTIEKLGKGLTPNTYQTVKVSYVGKLLDGTVFEQGIATGELSTYIVGWRIGIPLMPKGSKATLYIPSVYAYGPKGSESIPGNATLIFEVELLDIVLSNTEKSQLIFDIERIDSYLSANQITTAVKDTTGIRYTVTTEGFGAPATWYNKVKLNYTGKLMDSESQFGTGTTQPGDDFDSRVVDYIPGLQMMLQKMNIGAKVRVYIPSGLGYGPVGTTDGAIRSNNILYFDLEVVDIYRAMN